MNLSGKQWMAIVLAILGVLMASTSQLTDLLGPTEAKTIVTIAGLANSLMSSVLAALLGQSSLVRDVQDMPGVESIQVNPKANQTLAQMAIDPAQAKIESAPGAEAAVTKIAQGDGK